MTRKLVTLVMIPVEERLPEKGQRYEVLVRGRRGLELDYFSSMIGSWDTYGKYVTHWAETVTIEEAP